MAGLVIAFNVFSCSEKNSVLLLCAGLITTSNRSGGNTTATKARHEEHLYVDDVCKVCAGCAWCGLSNNREVNAWLHLYIIGVNLKNCLTTLKVWKLSREYGGQAAWDASALSRSQGGWLRKNNNIHLWLSKAVHLESSWFKVCSRCRWS